MNRFLTRFVLKLIPQTITTLMSSSPVACSIMYLVPNYIKLIDISIRVWYQQDTSLVMYTWSYFIKLETEDWIYKRDFNISRGSRRNGWSFKIYMTLIAYSVLNETVVVTNVVLFSEQWLCWYFMLELTKQKDFIGTLYPNSYCLCCYWEVHIPGLTEFWLL